MMDIWHSDVIKMIVQEPGGLSRLFKRGHTRNGHSFAVVEILDDPPTWVHVHVKSRRIAPAFFPSLKAAIQVAEKLENLGDWDAALDH